LKARSTRTPDTQQVAFCKAFPRLPIYRLPKFAAFSDDDVKVPEVGRSKRAVELAALREDRRRDRAKGLAVQESSEEEADDDVDINAYDAMMAERATAEHADGLEFDSFTFDRPGALDDLLL
jgi:hypothetical protein